MTQQVPPVPHVPRAEVGEGLQWLDDWRAGEFTPAPAADGWPVEMHGLASSYEDLARAYLRMLTALEHIRRETHTTRSTSPNQVLGPRPSPETTATEDDGEGEILRQEGWEIRLRFALEHEWSAHSVFEQLLEYPFCLHASGVRTLWLQELVWIPTLHLLEGEELRSIGRRFERL